MAAKPLESDPHELQRMMYTFRVNELKELLKALNVSTGGRKKDLQERAEHLLGSNNVRFQRKVNEIYERRYGPLTAIKTPPKPPISHSTAQAPPSYVIKHPDVKFKPFPFFQHIDSLIKPTALVSQTPIYKSPKNMKLNDMCIQFYLTPEQVRQIYASETTPGNYQVQVVLRFCRQETSCEQEDCYPVNCNLQINNQTCPIPNYNPMYSSRPDYKCSCRPINITSYLLASAAVVNTVSITWSRDILNPQGYCVSIDLMRFQSSSDLLQQLKNKSVRSSALSREMVKEKLKADIDSEISATCVRVTLICPLGKTRIQHPCRANSCAHFQCFDAGTYLQMNEKKARWVCPVCDKPAPFRDLILDGLMWEVCEKTSETDIEFTSDGLWNPIKQNKHASYNINTPPITTNSCPVTITDSPAAKGSTTASEQVVIDLTCDSDDDDDDDDGEAVMRPYSSPDHIVCSTAGVVPASTLTSTVAQPSTVHSTLIQIPINSLVTTPTTSSSSRVSVISHSSRKRKNPPPVPVPPAKFLPPSIFPSSHHSHNPQASLSAARYERTYTDRSSASEDSEGEGTGWSYSSRPHYQGSGHYHNYWDKRPFNHRKEDYQYHDEVSSSSDSEY